MAQDFIQQFQYNIDIVPDCSSLVNIKKKPTEIFGEYAIKWREQAARVKPPMKEAEMIDYFLQDQDPDYLHYMLAAISKPFTEVIKIGEIVENGMKSGKIEYVREQEPKKEFTPIGESYTSLYRKLMQLKLIEPIMPRYVNSNSKGFDSNARCEYHSNTQGHSTENCWTLKKAIENLVEAKAIVVTNNEDTLNITNNPLPAHDNTHFIGMIFDDRDYKQSSKTEMDVGTIGQEPKVIVSPPQLAPLIVKGASSSLNLAGSEKMTLYVPGSTKKLEIQLGGPKLYIPRGIQKIVPNNSLRNITEPVVIRLVAQVPVTNTKDIPWNYNKTIMTYRGKEIVEKTDKMWGLTRSGRYYSPEESRKAKQARESHLPVKERVAEKEAEEFLKKMKMKDYSIIDQLRKTPSQISLLSLLLHSEEHRRVLIKTLNEAYVSEKETVNQLEKMAERFFEVNRITFSDDDLPEEGAGHNRALHLMLNIDTNRIRTSNVSIRAFDGSRRDTIGEIELTMTISPVDFNIVFQVLNMETSYNFLLGRSWIHMARALPSTLHQMVKFEYDRQEVVVHGDNDSSIYKDLSLPCIEAKEGCESIIYQAFEVIEVDQVE
ncbi:uncharacterized protein [Nicotiana tomentosiformis]|uniref:uncharacterized protein n=1 Tax=Nicotiana tomentosiformis TaxID=4098 RepID=UPI00388CA263